MARQAPSGNVAEEAAVETAREVRQQADDGLFRLSSGVVLKIKPVPPLLIRQAVAKIKRPKPPVIFLEDKGVEEENPDDPE